MMKIYRCDDCRYCAVFGWVEHLYCLHPNLEGGATNEYSDGNKSAFDCQYFNGDMAHYYDEQQFEEAVDYPQGVKEWCLAQIRKIEDK